MLIINFIKKNLDNIIITLFVIIILCIAFFFGGKNIASREAYLKAEVQVKSTALQQRDLNNDLQKWYVDQNK